MNELAIIPATSLTSGQRLAAEIESEVVAVVADEFSVSRRYAKLARLLSLFKLNEGWRDAGHASFNSYLLTLKEKYNRSTQQLYAYVQVAEKLLPLIGEAALDKMGVTKATEIVKAAGKAKRNIPQELITAALDDSTGVHEVRALAHKLFELDGSPMPKGSYLDIGGFYVDDEQRAIFNDAVRISIRVLGLPPEMPDWQKRQRIILFWAQEINGTYAADAYGITAEAARAVVELTKERLQEPEVEQ